MDQMFSAYGEKESLGYHCAEEDISMEHIEQLAIEKLENFQEADSVFLSPDLYSKMELQFLSSMRYQSPPHPGNRILKVMTSAGALDIKKVPGLGNFCYVGTETSFKRLEWIQIDQEFEKVFFGDE